MDIGLKNVIREKNKMVFESYRVIQVVICFFILASILYRIQDYDQIIYIKEESRIWGGMFSLFSNNSYQLTTDPTLNSFGYSFILAPLYFLFKEPTIMYKAAIILNAVLLCSTFLISIRVAYSLFPEKNRLKITLNCFLLILYPGYSIVRSLSVPDIVMLFLFWLIIWLLVSISDKVNNFKIFFLGILIILSITFKSSMISLMIASIFIIIFLVKNQIINQKQGAMLGLELIIGLVLINLIERYWLNMFYDENKYLVDNSIFVLFNGIVKGWKENGILGFLQNLVGKLYLLCVNSFLFILPGFYFIIIKVKNGNKKYNKKDLSFIFSGLLFLIMLLLTCSYDLSFQTFDSLMNVRDLQIVASPIVLYGMVKLFENKNWLKELVICSVAFILSSFVLSSIIHARENMAIDKYNCGILTLFYNDNLGLSSLVFPATIMVLIIVYVSLYFYNMSFTKRCGTNIARGGAIILIILTYVFVNNHMDSSLVLDKIEYNKTDNMEIADLLKNTPIDGNIFYIKSAYEQNGKIDSLQFLLPTKKINVVDPYMNYNIKSDLDSYKEFMDYKDNNKTMYLIVSAQSEKLPELVKEFTLLEKNSSLAFLTQKENGVAEKIAPYYKVREYMPTNLKNDKESGDKTKIDTLSLSSGSYLCNVQITVESSTNENVGYLEILNGENVLNRAFFNLEGDKNLVVPIRVSCVADKKSISFRISNNLSDNLNIKRIIIQKTSPYYTIGLDSYDNLQFIINEIKEIDNYYNEKGKISFVNDDSIGGSDNLLDHLVENLPEYKISKIYKENVVDDQTEYYLFFTKGNNFSQYVEELAILAQNDDYVLMCSKDNKRTEYMKEKNGYLISQGRFLDIRGFLKPINDIYNYQKPIKIPSGNYNYVFEIKTDSQQLQDSLIGKINIKVKDTIIASKYIYRKDITYDNKLKIPLAIRKNLSNVTYEFISSDTSHCEVQPVALEIISTKFLIGTEEKSGLKEILSLISSISKSSYHPINIYYIATQKELDNNLLSTEYLENKLNNIEIVSKSQNDVIKVSEDTLLLLYNFNGSNLYLTDKYTVVAKEGAYTLWASTQGKLLYDTIEAGGKVLSNGKRVHVSCFNGTDISLNEQNSVNILKKGYYELSLNITKKSLLEEANAIIQFKQIKTDYEIKKEVDKNIQELIDTGQLKESDMKDKKIRADMQETISNEEVLGTYEVNDKTFDDGKSVNIAAPLVIDKNINKLSVEVLNLENSDISAELQWIEKKG